MTGAALTGRLGIIPTLGRIIRVYDPSEDKTRLEHCTVEKRAMWKAVVLAAIN